VAPADTNLSIDTILQSIPRLASGGIAMSCVSRPRSLVLNACVDECRLRTTCIQSEGSIMVRTVADQFADVLAAAGVKRFYGIVGDSLNGLTGSLR
jgi:hypothetical protein